MISLPCRYIDDVGRLKSLQALLVDDFGGVEGAQQVDVDNCFECVWRQLVEGRQEVSSSSVYQNIYFSRFAEEEVDCFGDFLDLSDISGVPRSRFYN